MEVLRKALYDQHEIVTNSWLSNACHLTIQESRKVLETALKQDDSIVPTFVWYGTIAEGETMKLVSKVDLDKLMASHTTLWYHLYSIQKMKFDGTLLFHRILREIVKGASEDTSYVFNHGIKSKSIITKKQHQAASSTRSVAQFASTSKPFFNTSSNTTSKGSSIHTTTKKSVETKKPGENKKSSETKTHHKRSRVIMDSDEESDSEEEDNDIPNNPTVAAPASKSTIGNTENSSKVKSTKPVMAKSKPTQASSKKPKQKTMLSFFQKRS